jgi:hypothetical protein
MPRILSAACIAVPSVLAEGTLKIEGRNPKYGSYLGQLEGGSDYPKKDGFSQAVPVREIPRESTFIGMTRSQVRLSTFFSGRKSSGCLSSMLSVVLEDLAWIE